MTKSVFYEMYIFVYSLIQYLPNDYDDEGGGGGGEMAVRVRIHTILYFSSLLLMLVGCNSDSDTSQPVNLETGSVGRGCKPKP